MDWLLAFTGGGFHSETSGTTEKHFAKTEVILCAGQRGCVAVAGEEQLDVEPEFKGLVRVYDLHGYSELLILNLDQNHSGAVGSPQLLMLSGIGKAKDLRYFFAEILVCRKSYEEKGKPKREKNLRNSSAQNGSKSYFVFQY